MGKKGGGDKNDGGGFGGGGGRDGGFGTGGHPGETGNTNRSMGEGFGSKNSPGGANSDAFGMTPDERARRQGAWGGSYAPGLFGIGSKTHKDMRIGGRSVTAVNPYGGTEQQMAGAGFQDFTPTGAMSVMGLRSGLAYDPASMGFTDTLGFNPGEAIGGLAGGMLAPGIGSIAGGMIGRQFTDYTPLGGPTGIGSKGTNFRSNAGQDQRPNGARRSGPPDKKDKDDANNADATVPPVDEPVAERVPVVHPEFREPVLNQWGGPMNDYLRRMAPRY